MSKFSTFFVIFLVLFCNNFLISESQVIDFPQKGAFEFNVQGLSEESLFNCGFMNHEITEETRIKVSSDGHLESNGKRIKIFGTNLSNLPTKENAAQYAKNLASLGYNCIRFHHLDANWTNAFIKRDASGKNVFNEEVLDQFDWFFFQLKENGIYSNLNLLTGRDILPEDGYPEDIRKIPSWKNRHPLSFWLERAVEDQKEYAKYLLTRKNPYTGLIYAEDPALAIVEVNNEQGMFLSYFEGWLETYSDSLWQLAEEKWNIWLKSKNLNKEILSKKYNQEEVLGNILATQKSSWYLEQHENAAASLKEKDGITKINIKKAGTQPWHIQYGTNNLSVKAKKMYTLKFKAKSSKNTSVNVYIGEAHEPWQSSNFSETVNLTDKWQDYEYTFLLNMQDTNARLVFGNLGTLKKCDIEISDIVLQEGGKIQTVKDGFLKENIALPRKKDFKLLPESYKNLICNFFYDLEKDYWTEMCRFFKQDIGCKALLVGTQIGCSTTGLMSVFDIIDVHAYWYHPVFPNEDWNRSDYYVENKTLTKSNQDDTMINLAKRRVFGKPFSVSEYDHPHPNQYSAEMFAFYAAYASFQDWDCIYSFCSDVAYDPKNIKIKDYFDQSFNPSKIAAVPLAARIFRQSLVSAAKTSAYVEITEKQERETLHLYETNGWTTGNTDLFGMDAFIGFVHKIGVFGSHIEGSKKPSDSFSIVAKKEQTKDIQSMVLDSQKGVYSDTGEIYFNKGKGIFSVQNADVSISVMEKNTELPIDFNLPKNAFMKPFIPTDDFASFIACRLWNEPAKSAPIYGIFCCSWSGNKDENLGIYGQKSKNLQKIIRSDCKLIASPGFGSKSVQTLSATGKIIPTANVSYCIESLDSTGNPKGNTLEDLQINRTGGTLWYLLKPVE